MRVHLEPAISSHQPAFEQSDDVANRDREGPVSLRRITLLAGAGPGSSIAVPRRTSSWARRTSLPRVSSMRVHESAVPLQERLVVSREVLELPVGEAEDAGCSRADEVAI